MSSKNKAGCVDCATFDLASEAALYVDCMLWINWYQDSDDMVFNFDTIQKLERHHSAELIERQGELGERVRGRTLAESIEAVRSEIANRVIKKKNSIKTKAEVVASLTEVLESLDNNQLCWEHDDDESSGDDEPSDDESNESDDSSESVKICAGNPIFQSIYDDADLKQAFITRGPSSSIVYGKRTKDKNKCITRAYNAHLGLNPNNATHFMNESGYVSSVHEHHLQHDGYTAYEGKEEDIQRTKEEIAWRRRVTHQMRGLHLALVHKKVCHYVHIESAVFELYLNLYLIIVLYHYAYEYTDSSI